MKPQNNPRNPAILGGDAIRRVFASGLTARDIAEPLSSWDAATVASTVAEKLRQQNFDVAGVREDGFVVGYAAIDQDMEGTCGAAICTFDDQRMHTTPHGGVSHSRKREGSACERLVCPGDRAWA